MLKNRTLGQKLALGFVALIALMVGLGVTGVVEMRGVAAGADQLAAVLVPEVEAASELNAANDDVALDVRAYGFTGEAGYIEKATRRLAEAKAALARCRDLLARHPDLSKLRDAADAAAPKLAGYEAAIGETVAAAKALQQSRDGQEKAAAEAIKLFDDLEAGQRAEVAKEVADKGTAAQLAERIAGLDLLADVQENVARVQVNNFKSQALRAPALLADSDARFKAIADQLGRLRSLVREPQDQRAVGDVRAAMEAYQRATTDAKAALAQLADANARRTKLSGEVGDAVDDLVKLCLGRTTAVATESSAGLSVAGRVMTGGLILAAAFGMALAWGITRSITGPIGRIISTLSAGAEQTTAAAGQVSASSQSLAQGASEQAASLEETSSALEEMSAMTARNADTARQASGLSGEAKAAADKGNAAMTRMTAAIHDIEKSAAETAKIIKVIDEIAFQTNLLALNAAVEAARAGEAGKGFAVVAEEVRNLAMRSAEAAKNTAALIEQSVQNSRSGVVMATDVGVVLAEITGAAGKVNSLVGEIAVASQEQSQGIGQVNTAVAQMDKVTQSNAAAAEESASASEELAAQAVQMTGVVRELMALVGVRSHAGSAGRSPARTTLSVAPPASHGKPKSHGFIPLEEGAPRDGFSEFGKAA